MKSILPITYFCLLLSADLGTNFYLTEKHIGVDRLSVVSKSLQELNPYVEVSAYTGDLTDAYVASFGAVVVTIALPLKELYRINETCRASKIPFVLAVTHGATCSFFADFGSELHVTDLDGEPTRELIIQSFSVDQIQVHVLHLAFIVNFTTISDLLSTAKCASNK